MCWIILTSYLEVSQGARTWGSYFLVCELFPFHIMAMEINLRVIFQNILHLFLILISSWFTKMFYWSYYCIFVLHLHLYLYLFLPCSSIFLIASHSDKTTNSEPISNSKLWRRCFDVFLLVLFVVFFEILSFIFMFLLSWRIWPIFWCKDALLYWNKVWS